MEEWEQSREEVGASESRGESGVGRARLSDRPLQEAWQAGHAHQEPTEAWTLSVGEAVGVVSLGSPLSGVVGT